MEKLLPKLRFPEFKGDWQKKKILELTEKVNSGKTPLGGEAVYTEEGILFIRSQNVNNDRLELENKTYIPLEINEGMKNSIVKPNDILLNITGASLGRSCVVPKDFSIGNVNQHVCIIRPRETVNPRFIQPQFSSKKGQDLFQSLQVGGGREGLNFESIKNIQISIPSIEEQTKIATFLSAVDEKLNLLKEKKALLEDYKKGMMQKIFSQELRFKDENGKDFADWEEKSLGDFGNTFNGLTGKTKENFGIGKPYIQYKQIFDNSKINIKRCEFVEISEKENQKSVQYGDVFFTVSSETPNEIGTASVLLDQVEEMYLNSFCFGFRANSLQELVPEFSRYLFRNELFRNQIVKLAQGSTRFNMSKVELMKLKVKLPSSEEQSKIATFLSAIDEKIELVTQQIVDTQEYKKGLLQQMFC
jgi:type I restriction enzyme, S subunit